MSILLAILDNNAYVDMLGVWMVDLIVHTDRYLTHNYAESSSRLITVCLKVVFRRDTVFIDLGYPAVWLKLVY